MPRLRTTTALAVLAVSALAAPVALAAPDPVPDRGPVLSEPMVRGAAVLAPAAAVPPRPKRIDGDAADWRSEPTRLGGTSRWDAGEHVHSDHVHDAWGADDGDDADRLLLTGPLAAAESRTTRLDALAQALGSQFDAPRPAGAPDHYGDALANDVADIATVRWAATPDGASLDLLVELTNLRDAAAAGVLLLVDRDGGRAPVDVPVAGLTSERFDTAVLLTAGGVRATDLRTGTALPAAGEVVVDASGWENLVEARLPADLLAPDGTLRAAVVTGRWDGTSLVPGNVAYRPGEPVAGMYSDQQQALALHRGSVDAFGVELAVADMRAGRTETARPGPGYHSRTFRSDPGISAELREGLDDVFEDTVWQRYALFVPSDHDPAVAEQLTFWLHYRGGKADSGGAWSPRLFTQLGEEVGGLVVTPHGRGERRWYEGSSHQDFWEVYEDVHATLAVDPARRYLSGYSMGGHGTPMMAMLYPDLFAGAYLQAAAIGRDLFDVAGNARSVPFWFDVSAQDGLVAVNQDLATTMRELGHRYVANTFTAGEHYTQAILDEWAAGARYLQQFEAPATPRRVTYRVVPSLLETINDGRGEPTSRRFAPDGAWWVDGIEVADGAPHGTVTAEARTLPGDVETPVPDLGDVRPGDHSVPSVRHGQAWATTPAALSPRVDVDLAGVSAVVLDAGEWRLDPATTTELVVVSDVPARVRLDDLPAGLVVRSDRGSVRGAVVDVPAGTTTVLLGR